MAAGVLGLVLGFSTAGAVLGIILRRQARRAIRDVYGLR
jgi:hypothetical protein